MLKVSPGVVIKLGQLYTKYFRSRSRMDEAAMTLHRHCLWRVTSFWSASATKSTQACDCGQRQARRKWLLSAPPLEKRWPRKKLCLHILYLVINNAPLGGGRANKSRKHIIAMKETYTFYHGIPAKPHHNFNSTVKCLGWIYQNA